VVLKSLLMRVGELSDDICNLRCLLWLLVTANVVPSSPILVTLMMEAIRCFESSVIATATWRNILEDGILHSHRRGNLNRLGSVVET
jgi:hypothetical protein